MTPDATNHHDTSSTTYAWADIVGLSTAYMPVASPNQLIQYASEGLVGEAAEVLELYKKAIVHMPSVPRDRVVEELGDLFYAASMLMTLEGISLEEVRDTLAAKLHDIYPSGRFVQAEYQDYRRRKHGGELK